MQMEESFGKCKFLPSYLFGGCEPEYCGAVEGGGDGEDAVEVVVLLQHRHDLQRADHHRHPLLDVVRPHDGLLQVPTR